MPRSLAVTVYSFQFVSSCRPSISLPVYPWVPYCCFAAHRCNVTRLEVHPTSRYFLVRRPSCPWSHGLRPKKFQLVWRCHQLLSGFLAKGHLPQVFASVMSVANDKGDNEMILGAVHRSPGICLTAEENPRKSQL